MSNNSPSVRAALWLFCYQLCPRSVHHKNSFQTVLTCRAQTVTASCLTNNCCFQIADTFVSPSEIFSCTVLFVLVGEMCQNKERKWSHVVNCSVACHRFDFPTVCTGMNTTLSQLVNFPTSTEYRTISRGKNHIGIITKNISAHFRLRANCFFTIKFLFPCQHMYTGVACVIKAFK